MGLSPTLTSQPAAWVWCYFGPSDSFHLGYFPDQVFPTYPPATLSFARQQGRETGDTLRATKCTRVTALLPTFYPCCISLPTGSTLSYL